MKKSEAEGGEIGRREVLKLAAGATAAAPFIDLEDALAGRQRASPKSQPRASVPAPRFFTAAELAMVDELAEMIIPADDHSPGARAAGVAAYLDKSLSELKPSIPEHAREQQTWRAGLRTVNTVSQEMHGRAFMQGTRAQKDAVLKRLAEQEPRPERATSEASSTQEKPKSPDENYREQSGKKAPLQEGASPHKDEGEFFVFFKGRVARAYYTSEIGMLRELGYPGNRYLQEFIGYDVNGNYTAPPPPRGKAGER